MCICPGIPQSTITLHFPSKHKTVVYPSKGCGQRPDSRDSAPSTLDDLWQATREELEAIRIWLRPPGRSKTPHRYALGNPSEGFAGGLPTPLPAGISAGIPRRGTLRLSKHLPSVPGPGRGFHGDSTGGVGTGAWRWQDAAGPGCVLVLEERPVHCVALEQHHHLSVLQEAVLGVGRAVVQDCVHTRAGVPARVHSFFQELLRLRA